MNVLYLRAGGIKQVRSGCLKGLNRSLRDAVCADDDALPFTDIFR